jgi:hypothetical protein
MAGVNGRPWHATMLRLVLRTQCSGEAVGCIWAVAYHQLRIRVCGRRIVVTYAGVSALICGYLRLIAGPGKIFIFGSSGWRGDQPERGGKIYLLLPAFTGFSGGMGGGYELAICDCGLRIADLGNGPAERVLGAPRKWDPSSRKPLWRTGGVGIGGKNPREAGTVWEKTGRRWEMVGTDFRFCWGNGRGVGISRFFPGEARLREGASAGSSKDQAPTSNDTQTAVAERIPAGKARGIYGMASGGRES